MLKHVDPLAEDLPAKRKRTAATGDRLIRLREAGMVIGAQSERTLRKLATQKENNEWTKQLNERSEKRRLHMLRKVVNKRLHNKLKSKDR